jgi:ATP-dependent Clp protease ATP-binding subunit ClpA
MARNLIVIATSNAGSDMIWNSIQNKEDLSKIKDKVIDSIIKDGVFKPELLNRFDGVILFHPLNNDHLRKIGEIMLEKLHDRLKEQGVDLVVNNDLVDYVVSFGTDPKFGARPMNRAIQEKVEEVVAAPVVVDEVRVNKLPVTPVVAVEEIASPVPPCRAFAEIEATVPAVVESAVSFIKPPEEVNAPV